jgi:hypothetical protein
MADESDGGGVLTFDPVLLQRGSDALNARPDRPALDQATMMSGAIQPAAFGTVPGAAEAAAKITQWLGATVTQLQAVEADVVDLGARAGRAAQMARDVDPETEAIARGATPGEAAAEIGVPADNRTGGPDA